jgi:hypothetical protein
MVRGSFFLEEIGFSAINTETASMKASIFGLLLMMWREGRPSFACACLYGRMVSVAYAYFKEQKSWFYFVE